MPINPRDTIFEALYQLLLTADFPITITNTDGRNMRGWQQLDGYQMPCMFLQEGRQTMEQNTANGAWGLERQIWQAACWVYFHRTGPYYPTAGSPAEPVLTITVINQVIDAINNVILNPCAGAGRQQTLAAQNAGVPLVVNVRVTEAAFDEGFGDPQAGQVIIRVGIEVLTARTPW